MPTHRLRRALPVLISIAIVIPLGLYGKRYHGPADHWVNDSLGGVLYVVLGCLLVALLLPRWNARRISLSVFAVTCVIEFLQLWHPPLLQWLRSDFVGRLILGSSFDWLDFPYYVLGGLLGWFWLRAIGHDAFVSK